LPCSQDDGLEEGLWIGLEECKGLFARLSGQERSLSPQERELLWRIESELYGRLSFQELESLRRSSSMEPFPGKWVPEKWLSR
jgi:hypothetical protein